MIRKLAVYLVLTASVPAFGATFIRLSASAYSVRENGSNAVVSVLRSANPHGTMTMTLSTSNGTALAGSDYVATSTIVTLRSGQRLKTVSIPIFDNLVPNSNKTFTVNLSNPSGGSLRNPKSAVVTIIDNDGNTVPNISIDNVSQNEGNVGTTPFVFHVTLSPPSTSTVSVAYATEDGDAIAGTDYTAANGTLTFNPGETEKIITVSVHGDTINEPDKVFFVNLTNGHNATVAPAQGIGVILNDDGPMATDDSYTTPENTALVVAAPGVLGNDTNVANNVMTTELASDVTHGTLALNPDGSFTYTPDANFIGADSFQYQAYDGVADSQVATVTITVQHINQAPVAYPDSYGTTPDTALDVPAAGVLANDFDPENDALGAAIVANPVSGAVTLHADGSFHYTPASGFTGIDTFSYVAFDGGTDSAPATVTIYVDATNHVPVANPDNFATPVNTALHANVLDNDTDADANPLTAILFTGAAHGTVALSSNGTFTYTPTNSYAGSDQFAYRASDGIATSGVAIVSIAVGSFNTAPVANDDDYSVAENETLTGNILTNDTDAQGDPRTATLVTGPAHGALTLNPDGSFEYAPDNDFSGTDTFAYRATDGALASNLGTVTITVTPVSGADDVDLYVKKATLKPTAFKMTGKVNPRGANNQPATLLVTLNGVPVTGTIKTKFNSRTGAYSFSATGADLAAVTGTPLHVTLQITGANLATSTLEADLAMPASGKFSFKRNRTLTGAFYLNKTTATQLADGHFSVASSGVIETEGGLPLAPTGTSRVTIDGMVAGNVTLAIVDAAHTFKLKATDLSSLGIPAASADAPVTYLLPVKLEVPTAAGTNVFETTIELKRPTGTSAKWKR